MRELYLHNTRESRMANHNDDEHVQPIRRENRSLSFVSGTIRHSIDAALTALRCEDEADGQTSEPFQKANYPASFLYQFSSCVLILTGKVVFSIETGFCVW